MQKLSEFLKINSFDLLKGFITAFLTSAITMMVQALSAGNFPTTLQLKQAAIAGLAAGGAYLLKNFFTNSEGQFLKPEA
jgi:hypothetical protein